MKSKWRHNSRHHAYGTWCTGIDRQQRIRNVTKCNSSPRPGHVESSLRYVQLHPSPIGLDCFQTYHCMHSRWVCASCLVRAAQSGIVLTYPNPTRVNDTPRSILETWPEHRPNVEGVVMPNARVQGPDAPYSDHMVWRETMHPRTAACCQWYGHVKPAAFHHGVQHCAETKRFVRASAFAWHAFDHVHSFSRRLRHLEKDAAS